MRALQLWMLVVLGGCSGGPGDGTDGTDTEDESTPSETDPRESDVDTDAGREETDPRNDTDPTTNLVPSARRMTIEVIEDTPLEVVLRGHDPDDDVLSFVIVSQPTHGVLTGTAPDLLYTPAPDHHGVDRFTFRASDGVLNSPVTEVLVQIAAVNDAPVAESQQVSARASGRRPITLVAADVDADPLTYRIVDGPAGGVLEGTPPNLVYVAPASAIEDSFTWTANDGVADSLIATVDVTVGDTNEPPIAIANSLVAQEDTARDVELWASDPDGDLLTYEITVAPNLGVLEGTGSQRSYVPEPDAWGVDSFRFRVSDGLAWSDEVTVQLTVVSVNDDPVADAMSAIEGHGGEDFVIDLSASDVDGDAVTFVLDSAPAVGTLDAPASGPWTWTPPADVEGTYLLSWHAEDPDGAWSNVVEVELVVLGAGPDWVATADAYESAGNYVLTVDATEGVLANDALGASYSCQIAAVSSTTELGGSVLLGCDGGFTYTPPLGVGGLTDRFQYTLTQPSGDVRTGSVSVMLHEVVWYVDASALTGIGRSDLPFPTLLQAQQAGAVGDIVFVRAGTYAQGITLRRNQQLVGAEFDLVVGGRVVGEGTERPLIVMPQGARITMAQGSSVRGFDIDSTAGTSIDVHDVSDVTVSDLTIAPAPVPDYEAAISVSGASDVVLTDFIVDDGRTAVSVYGSTGVQITDALVEDLDQGAIYVGMSSGVLVRNVAFFNTRDSLTAHDAQGSVVFEDCQFHASTGTAVSVVTSTVTTELTATIARNEFWDASDTDPLAEPLGSAIQVALLGEPDASIQVLIEENIMERPEWNGVVVHVEDDIGTATGTPRPYVRLVGNLVDVPNSLAYFLHAASGAVARFEFDDNSVDGDPAVANTIGLKLEADVGAVVRATVRRPWFTGLGYGVKIYANDTAHMVASVLGGGQLYVLEADYNGLYAGVQGTGEIDLHLEGIRDQSWGGIWLSALYALGDVPQLRVVMEDCEADAITLQGPSFQDQTSAAMGLASSSNVGTVYQDTDGGVLAAWGNGSVGSTDYEVVGSLKLIPESGVVWP